jgi:hypothetical protein
MLDARCSVFKARGGERSGLWQVRAAVWFGRIAQAARRHRVVGGGHMEL